MELYNPRLYGDALRAAAPAAQQLLNGLSIEARYEAIRWITRRGLPVAVDYIREWIQDNVSFNTQLTKSRFEQRLFLRDNPAEDPVTQQRLPRVGEKRTFGGDPKKVSKEAQGMQRIDYNVSRGGRKISKRGALMKSLEAHVAPLTERWGRCSAVVAADTVTASNFVGTNMLSAGPGNATFNSWPVYLFDLTGVKNSNSGIDPAYPGVAWRLQSTIASNDFSYGIIRGAQSTDAAQDAYTWTTERSARAVVPNAGTRQLIDGFKLDLTSYGAINLPSEVYVEMWRFTDEQVTPPAGFSSTTIGTVVVDPVTPDQLRMNEFWNQRLAKMIGRMDHKVYGNKSVDDGVEIKRIGHFVYNPVQSVEGLQAGHQRNLNYFHKWNKMFRYDHASRAVVPTAAEVDNPDVFYPEALDNSVTTHPLQASRWFLVIRGDVVQMNSTTGGAGNPAMFPSFDIILRRYRRLIKD